MRFFRPEKRQDLWGHDNYVDEESLPLLGYNVWDSLNEEFIPIQAVENEVLVNFTATTSAEDIEDLLEELDVTIMRAWFEPDPMDEATSMSWFHLKIEPTSEYFLDVPGIIAYLEAREDVEFAEYNDLVPSCGFPEDDPDDPYYEYQDRIRYLNADDAWLIATGGDYDTGVVIVDSGVDVDHEDLENQIYTHPTGGERLGIAALRKKVKWGDVDEIATLRELQTGWDTVGHGTAMAGIVAAQTDNGKGVAGLGPDLQVLPARLYLAADPPHSTIVGVLKKLRKKFKPSKGIRNVRVVNLSLTLYKELKSLRKAIKKDQKHNDRIYVACAGNGNPVTGGGKEILGYPAAFDFVLGVTAAADSWEGGGYPHVDVWHNLSNYWNGGGSTLDRDVYGISGYWYWDWTTDVTGDGGYRNEEEDEDADYGSVSGTSVAAAQISALAGLIYSLNDELLRGDVDDIIKQYTKGSDYATITFQDANENTKRIAAVADFERALDNAE